jgi:hypothetical protein
MRSGSYYAALQADREPEALGFDEAVFTQRDDAEIWAVHTEKLDNGNRQVGLKRIVPRWSAQMRALAFDEPLDEWYTDFETGEPEQLEQQFSSPSLVCLSTGAPGSWAYSCGNAGDKNFLAAPTTPSTENPFGKPREDPEIPTAGESLHCGAGTPSQGACNADEYQVGGCCFGAALSACYYQGCTMDRCDVTAPSGGIPGTARCTQ